MKLFILIALLALAAAIARLMGGVAVMSAEELGARSAAELVFRLADAGLELPPWPWLMSAISYLLLPGGFLVSRFGIDPASTVGLGFSALSGWWLWLMGARLCCRTIGGACGLTNIGGYRRWLWFAIPWRPIYKPVIRIRRWYRQFRFGKEATAAWTDLLSAMTLIYRPGDCVFLGTLWWKGINLNQPIGIEGSRHVMVIAASGAGKTRWLIGWAGTLDKRGSAFAIDCDGQIVNALGASLRRKGHPIYNLDPYHLSKFSSASWNALEEITRAVRRHGRQAAVRFAQTLAEALIQEDNKNQPVFATSARAFLFGLILYVWLLEDEERKNLVRVRELLTRGMPEHVIDPKQDPFDVLLSLMEQSIAYDDGCDGRIVAVIARAASVMRSGKTREGNPFRSTAISQTAWLDIPEIAAISERSDFAGEDLKLSNPCVFIVAPVTDIKTKLAGWVRALTMMTMYAFQNMPGRLKIPCAFLIDEAPALGRMEILETAAPVFRKYGIRLVMVAQDIERLKHVYPDSWEGFIGNAQVTLWMSTDHQATAEYLSKVLGSSTIVEELKDGKNEKTARMHRREQLLMTPDQVRQFLDPDRLQIIVTRTGKQPLRLGYLGYDKALSIFDYDADPSYREPILRALTRGTCNWLVPRGTTRFRAPQTSECDGSAASDGSPLLLAEPKDEETTKGWTIN